MTIRNARSLTGDPFGGELELKFSGRRRAGVLQFILAGGSTAEEIIPAKPWGTLLILAEFAKKYSSVSAYLTSEQLANQLMRHGVLALDEPQRAVQLVHRLRRSLGRLSIAEKLAAEGHLATAEDFGQTLVRRSTVLGYRLALPPDSLIIELDEEE